MILNEAETKTNSCFDASVRKRHKPDVHGTPDNDASLLTSASHLSSLTNLQETEQLFINPYP